MKLLVEQVLSLIKAADPAKVLSKYTNVLNTIKNSKRLSLSKRHIMFNQLHHGVSCLLAHTLTPGSLSHVFLEGKNPLLATVIGELKASMLKKRASKAGKWNPSK